jgi:signal transduction histidine kinase
VKHAPGEAVTVMVRVHEHDIDVKVTNPVAPSLVRAFGDNGHLGLGQDGAGQGIRGMTERAELLGGTARAFNGDGTWKVEANIPWSDAE